MEYGNAYTFARELQNLFKDERNIVVKKSEATKDDNFVVCVRRISFSGPILQLLIDYAEGNKLEMVVRNADREISPDECYTLIKGNYTGPNIVAILY